MTPEPIFEVAPVGPQFAVPGQFYSYPYPFINNEVPVGWTSGNLPRNLKPRGHVLLPYPKDKTPPPNAPDSRTLGVWITIDSGWGAPPVYGFLAREPGLESGEPSFDSQARGHYVYVRGDAWAWVPEIDPSFGMK